MDSVVSQNTSERQPWWAGTDGRAVLFTGAVLVLAVLVAAMAGALLSPRALDNAFLLPAAAVAALGGATVALLRPRWVFSGFLLACMVTPFFLEETHVALGFMKLYIQDLVFLFCLGLIAVRTSVGRTTWKPIPFNAFLLAYFALGLWGLFVGLKVTGQDFNNAFGDFRRAFFYFMNYFVILLLTDNLADVRRLRGVLTAGGLLLTLKGALQLLSGQFYVRRFGDAAHILSHFELTFLSFVIFFALAQLLYNRSASRWLWGTVAAASIMTTIVGNYRAAWLSLVGGLIFMFLYLPRRGKLTLAALGAMGAVFLGLAVAVLWDVQVEGHSTLGQDILAKADFRNTTQDVNVTWRFESYRNALGLWQRSPWIGRGLGEELEFSAPTSTGGAMLARGHRVHNSFIWLLMSVGVTGFLLFLTVQAVYFGTLLRYLRRSTWTEGRLTVMACGAFYVSFMISTSFEIFLESAMPITVLSASVALAMLMIHYTPREHLPR